MGLLDIFIEREPKHSEAGSNKKELPQVKQPVKPPENTTATQITVERTVTEGEFNEDIFNKLNKEIEANNLPGVDYFEFKQSLLNMGALAIDEEAKFSAAFAVLKASGLTKEVLANSLDHYLNIMKREKGLIESEIKEIGEGKISQVSETVTRISNAIAEKNERIEDLKKDIENLKLQLTDKESEHIEIKNSIQKQASDFNVTVGHIIDQMQNDKDKIVSFLE